MPGLDVTIGQQCVLQENVSVRHDCVVGDRVRLGASTVVGGDGFGYRFADGVHHKIVHAGIVISNADSTGSASPPHHAVIVWGVLLALAIAYEAWWTPLEALRAAAALGAVGLLLLIVRLVRLREPHVAERVRRSAEP